MSDGSRVRKLDETMAIPLRHKMWQPEEYAALDPGIRFAVKVLHAALIDTGQSCHGGEGHSYEHPTIDCDGPVHEVFAALHALESYGLHVRAISRHWSVENGLVFEVINRITLWRAYPDRADEWPIFVQHSQAQPLAEPTALQSVPTESATP